MTFRELIENKTPTWSIKQQKFIHASSGYIKAMKDIEGELITLGKDKNAINKWIENNNGDFIVESNNIN